MIVDTLDRALGARGPLAGRHVVVTAGGTREAIDPVRVLTNRSSGRMGYALARAALLAGAEVTLITTPTGLAHVEGATVVPATSALDMLDAVRTHVNGADALVMAAAIADYRPAEVAEQKMKKSDDDLTIRLVRNPDILMTLETPGTLRVGFAAETENIAENARGKLARKRLDLIVANDARLAMDSDENTVTLYFSDGSSEVVPRDRKEVVSALIVKRIGELLARDSA
jgi:phosphopantothenoylcysteine decarboxylase/phosphopantothenate--cysteine ligase